ncbi:MAG: N-acyl homoserine lactonase family protein [Hyphomonadaceae bacterium]
MKNAAIALLSALALGACAQSQTASAPAEQAASVRLYAMNCGELNVSNADAFADDGSYAGVQRRFVVPCYLIRHPQGDLIWDTGLPDALALLPDGRTTPIGHMRMARTLASQLAELGLTPADIEFLSVSHSHVDHIGNGGLFAQSTWIVDPDERAHAFRDAARADTESFSFYSALENAQTRLIEGDAPHDVFGDGSVQIVPTPGHTPGHTILQLRLANAGVVLLTGDMWHLAESREGRRVPRFNVNREQTLASMDRIEAIAAATNARVVREHVPEDFEALPAFPAYLD